MATLKDVAREAGLSVGTVSRVLNNRGYISEETRNCVQEAMKRLHYEPNEMARALSKKHSTMIGVILPSISHPYFAKVLSCLERAAHARNYELLLFCSQGKSAREEEYVRVCCSNRVAGLVLCSG
ncbi:MAG TPA: LacI family transcriptional regulator, partial [Lachnospiraceae bacterium]|nr:LacI family transcriptional regulator [Lachnospiraceae bacterium]